MTDVGAVYDQRQQLGLVNATHVKPSSTHLRYENLYPPANTVDDGGGLA